MNKPLILYVMGVSGSGKSTIGKLLADTLGFPYYDGDDYHPPANIEKMSSGKALNDSDRKSWLETLNTIAITHKQKGAVIVCSALKQAYRELLRNSLEDTCQFVFLEGSMNEISDRLAKRNGHFMPQELLQSQFDTLEKPNDAITVSIKNSPDKIVQTILERL